jgi:hypothetical protein
MVNSNNIISPDPKTGISEFERILREKREALRRDKTVHFGWKGRLEKAVIELRAWSQAVKETIKNTRKLR